MVSLETMPSRLLSAQALKNAAPEPHELLAELNAAGGIASEEVAQLSPTIQEDLLTEIHAI